MTLKKIASQVVEGARAGLASLVMLQMGLAGPFVPSAQANENGAEPQAVTPIQHVIVIVGENRTFDHIFATYQPKAGESVHNLRSEQIVNADGTPGPNYGDAGQYSADATNSTTFQLAPTSKSLYGTLPAPLNGGPTDVCKNNGICSMGKARSSEYSLANDYYQFMLTGGTGLSGKVPDSRITGVSSSAPYSTLKPGPFQLTNSTTTNTLPYDSYAASPVHRFYQGRKSLCRCLAGLRIR